MALPIIPDANRPSLKLVAPAAALPDHALVTCPSCHAEDPVVSNRAVADGAAWVCARCGQEWDAQRLDSVAAYDGWALDHDGRKQS